uniref:Uncharacterized protein n=1 Tax=viral metagenome TaxID=1070528 RepID=A0A6C0DRA7_9ZZZZ
MPTDPKHQKLHTAAASANRLSGKTASDAFKKRDNAGMLFKKDMKHANTIEDVRTAQQRLRMKECSSSTLRGYTN